MIINRVLDDLITWQYGTHAHNLVVGNAGKTLFKCPKQNLMDYNRAQITDRAHY